MILALDHRIFGNGHGLRSPHCDNRFYWLGGRLYTFMPGHGAQLHSIQWRMPLPGERRTLGGREYRVFSARRSWGRVYVAWALTRLPQDINEANALLRTIKQELGEI